MCLRILRKSIPISASHIHPRSSASVQQLRGPGMQFPNRRRISALRDVWLPVIVQSFTTVLFNDNVRVLGSKVFFATNSKNGVGMPSLGMSKRCFIPNRYCPTSRHCSSVDTVGLALFHAFRSGIATVRCTSSTLFLMVPDLSKKVLAVKLRGFKWSTKEAQKNVGKLFFRRLYPTRPHVTENYLGLLV